MLAGRLSCQHVAQRSNRAFEQQRPCLHFHCVCATDPNHSDSRAKLWVPVVNKVYRPQEFATTRTPIGRLVIIGDVHGCVVELAQLLKKVDFNRAQDRLVFVGDLVNKGPRSQQAVQLAMALDAIVVRGNHDDAALWSYRNLRKHSSRSKEDSKYQWVLTLTPKEAAFMAQMPFTVTVPSLNIIIAHAGLVPGVPIAHQRLTDVYRMRVLHQVPVSARLAAFMQRESQEVSQPSVTGDEQALQDDPEVSGSVEMINPDDDDGDDDAAAAADDEDEDDDLDDPGERENGSAEPEPDKAPWASKWAGPGHVIFGHDARIGLQQYDYATGIDTGCVYGRRLTACLIPLHHTTRQYKRDQTPTLEELHASLVSVPARERYR